MPWSSLNDDLREANRAQARDIAGKLESIGCVVSAGAAAETFALTDTEAFAFTDAEVEALGQREHLRWSLQRQAAGWSYGDFRDDVRKRHPSLVSWARLSESEREKDRAAVRDIPAVIASIGRIRRTAERVSLGQGLVERLAEAIHERYLDEQVTDGVALGTHPAMTRWATLPADRKVANREQARDIGAKLALIGCAVVPIAESGSDFAFTAAELDVLARHEQRRWASQHTAAGWSYGPSIDETLKRHPGLVSYEELPEIERDKDRDAVRSIPLVLAAAGLGVVRVAGRQR
jgi:hypothetical protein